MEKIRDPLVLVYETLKKAIQTVHGQDFLVFDDFPDSRQLQKTKQKCSKYFFCIRKF